MKKNHHFVPQFYLRNFSQSGKNIGMYIFDAQKHVLNASIRGVAYREYLYGRDEEIENGLADNEGEWAEIINRIILTYDLKLNEEEYIMLLLFICMSDARTLKMADIYNKHLNNIANAATKLKPLDKKFGGRINYSVPNLLAMQVAAETVNILSDLQFILLINESNTGFVTSDNPVVKYNQMFRSRNYYSDYGIGQMGIQLFVPLSPRICLCLFDDVMYIPKQMDKVVITSSSQITELNKLFMLNAYKSIFFHPDQERSYIQSLIKKKVASKQSIEYPVFGDGLLIPLQYSGVRENIKLPFFEINPDLRNMYLPLHMAGPLRPTAKVDIYGNDIR